MKKIINKLMTLAMAVALVMSFTACGEVINGSKIERIKITFAVSDADNNVTDVEATALLYMNFAPETIAHVKQLIADNYYNNTCVSNVTSSYAQFGDCTLNEKGELQFKDQGASIDGEFRDNGWGGNRLNVESGALVLKRADKAENEDGTKYNTGKATIAVCFGSSAFDANKYCVFGKFDTSDGDSEADSSTYEYLSSRDRVAKLSSLTSDDDGRKIYYCVSDDATENSLTGKYFTYYDGDYYEGILTVAQINEGTEKLDENAVEALTEKMGDSEKAEFYTLPVYSVIIKSITLVK